MSNSDPARRTGRLIGKRDGTPPAAPPSVRDEPIFARMERCQRCARVTKHMGPDCTVCQRAQANRRSGRTQLGVGAGLLVAGVLTFGAANFASNTEGRPLPRGFRQTVRYLATGPSGLQLGPMGWVGFLMICGGVAMVVKGCVAAVTGKDPVTGD